MIISENQFNKLPAEFQQYFKPKGGGVGVSRNAHPT